VLDVFGCLAKSVHSDRGPQFVSSVWIKLLGHSEIELKLSSGYCPEGNGLSERMIQNLVQTLRTICFSSF
jgi:transposase InsO family protein